MRYSIKNNDFSYLESEYVHIPDFDNYLNEELV